ncbi:hypothetical protein DPMN_130160 [Dreissena polymorpha]|uniref:Uncharacterized protein n=1 Tax=Dreissena polymorpha TaxID=45954 RepID=A0A9D4H6B0_DREPO|nr:hypothetical protein DPMN_130160 [Dreissena polymorpha]
MGATGNDVAELRQPAKQRRPRKWCHGVASNTLTRLALEMTSWMRQPANICTGRHECVYLQNKVRTGNGVFEVLQPSKEGTSSR